VPLLVSVTLVEAVVAPIALPENSIGAIGLGEPRGAAPGAGVSAEAVQSEVGPPATAGPFS